MKEELADQRVSITFKGDSRPTEDDLRAHFNKFGAISDIRIQASTAVLEFSENKNATAACKTPVVKLPGGMTVFVRKITGNLARPSELAMNRRQSAFSISDSSGDVGNVKISRRESIAVVKRSTSSFTEEPEDEMVVLEQQLQELDEEIKILLKEGLENTSDIQQIRQLFDEIDTLVLGCASIGGELFSTCHVNAGLVDEFIACFAPRKKQAEVPSDDTIKDAQ